MLKNVKPVEETKVEDPKPAEPVVVPVAAPVADSAKVAEPAPADSANAPVPADTTAAPAN